MHFYEGYGFSRAVKSHSNEPALAAEVCFSKLVPHGITVKFVPQQLKPPPRIRLWHG